MRLEGEEIEEEYVKEILDSLLRKIMSTNPSFGVYIKKESCKWILHQSHETLENALLDPIIKVNDFAVILGTSFHSGKLHSSIELIDDNDEDEFLSKYRPFPPGNCFRQLNKLASSFGCTLTQNNDDEELNDIADERLNDGQKPVKVNFDDLK